MFCVAAVGLLLVADVVEVGMTQISAIRWFKDFTSGEIIVILIDFRYIERTLSLY